MSNQWYGCRRDTRDARDHLFRVTRISIPPSFDLRAHCPPVMDQGQLGSCTAHGITGALRHALISRGEKDFAMSRLQLYYDERVIEGSVDSDAGAEIRDGIKTAGKLGVAHETLWPYKIGSFTKKPPVKVYTDAIKFRALSYERVPIDFTPMRKALAAGFPIVIGVSLYQSFEDIGADGVLPMPNLKTEQMIGGHCMYVVGYGQKKGHFTVRNSWGTSFGDSGDIYMPFEYLGSPKFGADYWIIKTEGAA